MCSIALVPPSSVVYTLVNIVNIHIILLEKICRDHWVSSFLFSKFCYVCPLDVDSMLICHNDTFFASFPLGV